MAKRAATTAVAAMLAAGFLAAARPATAAPAAVVLHLTSYEHLPVRDIARAWQDVVDVYAKIGVHVVWVEGAAAGAPADGALHLDVILLTAGMADRIRRDVTAFGLASHVARRAYIFCTRVFAHASETGSDPSRVLGLVLAHEIGHMLLPEHSHTVSGLMMAEWAGTIHVIPDFLPAQAATIRTLLAEPQHAWHTMAAR